MAFGCSLRFLLSFALVFASCDVISGFLREPHLHHHTSVTSSRNVSSRRAPVVTIAARLDCSESCRDEFKQAFRDEATKSGNAAHIIELNRSNESTPSQNIDELCDVIAHHDVHLLVTLGSHSPFVAVSRLVALPVWSVATDANLDFVEVNSITYGFIYSINQLI